MLRGTFEFVRWGLMRRVKQDFIPNDVTLGGKLPNLVLLTGANMVHLNLECETNYIGWKVDSFETDLYCRHYGTTRMLCPCSKRENDTRRSHHVSFGCK